MMTPRFIPAFILGAALAVSGCVGTADVSRDMGFDDIPVIENLNTQNWTVVSVEVDVPADLTTSEANRIKPRADIVWTEEAYGNRHAQVDALMTEELAPAFAAVTGAIPVVVELQLTRFHAQTHRVRYSNFPSEHEIEFVMVVRHADTGALLSGPTDVDLTFAALGGDAAIEADAAGITQRDRISERLQAWVAEAFIAPAAPARLIAAN